MCCSTIVHKMCIFFFHNAVKEGPNTATDIPLWINTVKKVSYCLCLVHHNLLFLKWNFKSLSGISAAPVSMVFTIYIPTQMEPSFIIQKCKFWVKKTIMCCSQNQLRKCILYPKSSSSDSWTCLILYGRRCNVLVAFRTVLETRTFRANWARGLRIECSNLAPVSSSTSLVSTVLCV
jgi:hypothetical protein